MKELNNKTKISMLLVCIIIIIGVVITLTKGLNFELKYQDSKRIELYIEKQFDISDIKKITDEELAGQDVIIQKVEVYEDSISIIAKDITEEQKANIINKVNEKYGTELSADNVEIQTIPHVRGRDIIKPYMVSFVVASIFVLVYNAIRYYKLGIIKTSVKSILAIIIAQLLLLSIIAITRIPVGRIAISLGFIVYVITLLVLTNNLEKKLEKQKEKEQKATNN